MSEDALPIAAQRIGTPAGWFVLAIVLLVLGGFLSIFPDTQTFWPVLATIGAGLIAVGFWVLLFGRIEQRLMDIERAIVSSRPDQAPIGCSADGQGLELSI